MRIKMGVLVTMCLCVCLGLSPIAKAALMAKYTFDDSTANDSSGNGNNGALLGTAVVVDDAIRGKVLSFAGDTTGRMDVPHSSSLSIGGAGCGITIAMWVNTSNTSTRQIIEKAATGSTMWYNPPWGIRMEPDRRLRLNWGNGLPNPPGPLYSTAIPLNTWTHFAMTYDSTLSANQRKFYINGVLSSQSDWTTVPTANTSPIRIGYDYYNSVVRWGYLGKLDDIRIFNAALSAAEIPGLMTDKIARDPNPANGAIGIPGTTNLQWSAGVDPNDNRYPGITQHYLHIRVLDAASIPASEPNFIAPGTLNYTVSDGAHTDPVTWTNTGNFGLDKRVFWRVDESVNNSTQSDPNTIIGSAWSFDATKSVPVITAHPANVVVDNSGTATAAFTVTATCVTQPVTYTWYKTLDNANNTSGNDVVINTDTNSNGTSTLTLNNVTVANEGYYFCIASNGGGSTPTNVAKLGVKRNVVHWTLDGLVGGQYADSTSEGHNADPNGTPVFVAGAGTGTNNGVQVDANNGWARAGTWNPSQYTGQLTISMWVRWAGPSTPAGYQGLIGKRSGALSDTTAMWQLEIESAATNRLSFKSSINGVTSPILPLNTWEQVVVTYDGTTATIYRNGTRAVSGAVTLNAFADANMLIGAVGQDPLLTVPTSLFNGDIDDIRIYNYALDPVTIAYSYTDVSGGTACSNPLDSTLVTYDLNKNCKVDLGDLAMMASNWLYTQLVPNLPRQ